MQTANIHSNLKNTLLKIRSCSKQKYPLLVLLQLLLENSNSYRSRLWYSGSCTPLTCTTDCQFY